MGDDGANVTEKPQMSNQKKLKTNIINDVNCIFGTEVPVTLKIQEYFNNNSLLVKTDIQNILKIYTSIDRC